MTKEELLAAVSQLSTPDLEEFVSGAIVMRAKRRAPSISRTESELLSKINQGLPSDLWQRSEELTGKLEDETLTPEEHAEFMQISAQIRELEVERVKLLAELADLRGVTLSKLMQELEIDTFDSLQTV